MTYAYYHQVKRGSTPKTAPTFRIAYRKAAPLQATSVPFADIPTTLKKVILMQGYPPEHLFEDIPHSWDSWKCPLCGAGKDQFKKV